MIYISKNIHWIILPMISCIGNFVSLYFLTEFHINTNGHCFIFAHLDTLQRLFQNHFSASCNFVFLMLLGSIFCKLFIVFVILKRNITVYLNYFFYLVFVIDLLIFIVCFFGVEYTCRNVSPIGLTQCSREVFKIIDFYTFTPKYMRAFSFPEPYHITMICSVCSALLMVPSYVLYKNNGVFSGCSSV